MIKKFDKYNESVKDKMTPKDKGVIRELLYKFFESKKVNSVSDSLKEMSFLDFDNLYFIGDETRFYNRVDECLYEICRSSRVKEIIYPSKIYRYYPDKKVVKWSNRGLMDGIYFDGSYIDTLVDYIVEGKITESVRDKMTPKKDAMKKLNLLMTRLTRMFLEDGYFDDKKEVMEFLNTDGIYDNLMGMVSLGLSLDEIYVELSQFNLDEYLFNKGLPLKFAFNEKHRDDKNIVGSDAYNRERHMFYYDTEGEKDKYRQELRRRIMDLRESVRDKMTPKPPEKINKKLLGKINRNKKFGRFDPLEWGLKLEDFGENGSMSYFMFRSDDDRKWAMFINDIVHLGVRSDTITMREVTPNNRSEEFRTGSFDRVEMFLSSRGLKRKINEGVRDYMTPKSKEDIEKNLKKMSDDQKMEMMLKFIHRDDIQSMLVMLNNGLEVNRKMINAARKNHNLTALSLLNYTKDKRKKLNEGVRDKMTPKSDEEMNEIMDKMTPRELFLTSFRISIDTEHPTKRPMYKRAMKFMKPFKDVKIGDLVTISPHPGYRNLPLYPVKEKIRFNDVNEYKEYKKENPKVVIADRALDVLFRFTNEQQTHDAIVVDMGVDYIFPYGQVWTGVFPYTEEELKLRAKPHPRVEGGDRLNIFNDTFESVRDRMTPKSEEEIRKSISEMSPMDIVKQLVYYPYLTKSVFSDSEIRDILSKTEPNITLRLVEHNVKLLKILLDTREIGEFNNRYIYQLLYDSMKKPGYEEVVRHLIDNMDDINRDHSAYLRFAIDQDVSDDIVKYLIRKGAEPSLAMHMWRNSGLNREEHIKRLRRLESEVLRGK